ncbi:pyridoxal phosphate-dependent aminotransferase [Thermospira aquatica]|uniref:Pyridoxal phosphate-dependent aminotransferase n=1 Tax=Thermospira aquatica TaxID=2828656 RepID=A0AAX3BA73_9SPIR|nr:pyridoxal phosphate-dependent aminotransferase [Thermospira aquatica]URA09158.1 pyridoxal phosphate-dependent aminotransferase [Thermospira aquatica]
MRLSKRLFWEARDNSWAEASLGTNVLYDLTISNPTKAFDLSAYTSFVLEALCQAEALSYEPSPLGHPRTREFLANHLPFSSKPSAHQILLTTSTSEAYSFLFKLLCDPGDEVLVPVPSYPLFEYLARLDNVHIVPYRLEYLHGKGYEVDFGLLERRITSRTKALVAVHPNNPTGTGFFYRDIERIVELAQRCDFALIVDEVFSDFWIEKPDDVPFSWWEIPSTVPLFVLGGLSKSLLMPQMKLAWTVFRAPDEESERLLRAMELLGDTYLSPSTPIQLALPQWWKIRGELQHLVSQRIQENLSFLRAFLPDYTRLLTYHGGWSAVIEFPAVVSEERLIHEALFAGVRIFPGYFFDFEREGYLVTSLLTPSENLMKGMESILSLLKHHLS